MKEEVKTILHHVAVRIVYWSTDWSVDSYDFLSDEEKLFLMNQITRVSNERTAYQSLKR